jgi:hypothetical protein
MTDGEDGLPEVSRHIKILFGARAAMWTLVIMLSILTVAATWAVVYRIDKANDRLIDCIVPTGQCYNSKIRGVNQISTVDVNVAVEWCGNQPYNSVGELRRCVNEQLRILR